MAAEIAASRRARGVKVAADVRAGGLGYRLHQIGERTCPMQGCDGQALSNVFAGRSKREHSPIADENVYAQVSGFCW